MRAAQVAGEGSAAASASRHIAWCCFQISDIETGLAHASSARTFFRDAGCKDREIISASIYAWLLLETGLVGEASDEASHAVAEAEECASVLAKAWALNALAVVFWYCKQLERAEALSLRAVALARSLGDPQLLSWWLINLAGIRSEVAYRLGAANDEDGLHRTIAETLDINDEAVLLADQVGDRWALHLGLCNAAEYHTAAGRFTEAEADLERWSRVGPATGPRARTFFLTTKSQLLSRQARWDEAQTVCEVGLARSREHRNTDLEAHALRFMSEIQEGLGRFDLALGFFKRFHAVQSTLAAEQIQRRARLAEIRHETERLKRHAEQETSRADALARTSRLDPLTGIGNRRLLDETFERLRTELQPFCVAVLDLDRFKRINDRFSHAVGDAVLRRVGALLRASLRPQDVAARVGGEEFVVVQLGAKQGAALSICRRIMEGLMATDWSDLDPALRVTASIGIASHVEAVDPAHVMALADRRLYGAEEAGRDRIVAFAPPGAKALAPLDLTLAAGVQSLD